MKKLFAGVFILFLLASKAYGYSGDKYNVSVFFNAYKPDSVMGIKGSNAVKLPPIKFDYGGGFTYNNLRVGFGTYLEGYRGYFGYDFFYQELVSPYFGVSYIGGTSNRYSSSSKQYLQGVDAIVGVSINFYNIVKPYIEYSLYNNYFHYGFRIHLYKNFSRN